MGRCRRCRLLSVFVLCRHRAFNDLVKRGRITVNEDYFISLLGYTDISNSVSYSDFITSRQLSALNIAGMAFFYALNFLFRRAAEFVFDAVTRKTSSKLTMALSNSRRKRKANKLFAPTTARPS